MAEQQHGMDWKNNEGFKTGRTQNRDSLNMKDYREKGIKEMTPRILVYETGWIVVSPAKKTEHRGSLIDHIMTTSSSNIEILQTSITFLLPQFSMIISNVKPK